MLRYIFLSVFALLLLTACGDGDTGQDVSEEPASTGSADGSSNNFSEVFGNQAGIIKDDDHGADVDTFLQDENTPKRCPRCDLTKIGLPNADLFQADLSEANLTGANLIDAFLDGVTGADFTGAVNVPAK